MTTEKNSLVPGSQIAQPELVTLKGSRAFLHSAGIRRGHREAMQDWMSAMQSLSNRWKSLAANDKLTGEAVQADVEAVMTQVAARQKVAGIDETASMAKALLALKQENARAVRRPWFGVRLLLALRAAW